MSINTWLSGIRKGLWAGAKRYNYNPNQPRDSHGRWTKGGMNSGVGGSSVTPQWVAGLNSMEEVTDEYEHEGRRIEWLTDSSLTDTEQQRREKLHLVVDAWQGGSTTNGNAFAYQIRDAANHLIADHDNKPVEHVGPFHEEWQTDDEEMEYLKSHAEVLLSAVNEAPRVSKKLYRGLLLDPDFVSTNLVKGATFHDPIGSWSGKKDVSSALITMRQKMGVNTPQVSESSTERVLLVSDKPKAVNITPLNTQLAQYKLTADEYLSGGDFEVVKVEHKNAPVLTFTSEGIRPRSDIFGQELTRRGEGEPITIVHVKQKSTYDPHLLVEESWDKNLRKTHRFVLPDTVPAGFEWGDIIRKYDPNQPRDEQGRWTDGGSRLRPIDSTGAKRFDDAPPGSDEEYEDFNYASNVYWRWAEWEGVRNMRHAAEHLLGLPDSFSPEQEAAAVEESTELDRMNEIAATKGHDYFTDNEWESARNYAAHGDSQMARFLLDQFASPATDKVIVLESEIEGDPLTVGLTNVPLWRGVHDGSADFDQEGKASAKADEWFDNLLKLQPGDTIDFGLVAASPERATAEGFAGRDQRSAFIKFLPGTKVFTADDINFEAITSGRFEVVKRSVEKDQTWGGHVFGSSVSSGPQSHEVFEVRQIGVFELPNKVKKNVGDHIKRLPSGSYRRTTFDGLFDTPLYRRPVKFAKASKPLGSRFFGKEWQEDTYERMVQVGMQELSPRMAIALSDLFAYITENGLLADVLKQLDNGSLNNIEINLLSAIARIDIPPDVVQQFLSDAFHSGVSINVDSLRARAKEKNINFDMQFDMVNPYAVEWAYRQGAALVVNITRQTQDILRTHIEDALINGHSPRELSKMIRRYVGLDPRWARAVDRYEDGLRSAGDLRSGQINRMVDAYAQRLTKARAVRIARTEILRAQNVGQSAVWIEMAKVGLIDRNLVRKKWIVTGDDKLCKYCQRMEDESLAYTDLHGWFQTPLGLVFEPPMHPHCRCTQVLDVPDPLDLVRELHLDDDTGYDETIEKYRPDQPRDERGRWTDGGRSSDFSGATGTAGEQNRRYLDEMKKAFPNARIEVTLEEPNERAFQGVARAATELSQDYPTTAKHVKNITIGPISGGQAIGRQETTRDGINIQIDTVAIAFQHLNTMNQKDPSAVYGSVQTAQHAGEAVFIHEFAHAIYSMAEAQVIAAQWKQDGYVPEARSGFGAIQTKLVLGLPLDPNHRKDFKTVVAGDLATRYGRKNPGELWAEQFTMDRLNVRTDRLGPLFFKYRDWYINTAEHDGISQETAKQLLADRNPYSKARQGGFLVAKDDDDLNDDFVGSFIFDPHAFDADIAKYNPNQPRDYRGRWTTGAAGDDIPKWTRGAEQSMFGQGEHLLGTYDAIPPQGPKHFDHEGAKLDRQALTGAVLQGKPVKIVGVHGDYPYKMFDIQEHGFDPTKGSGFFGGGTYFSALDESGIDAQGIAYRARGVAVEATLSLKRPLVIESVARSGQYADWTRGVIESVIRTGTQANAGDYLGGYKEGDWYRKGLLSLGFDSIVYLSDSDTAGSEHGSQIIVLKPEAIHVTDWHVDSEEWDHLTGYSETQPVNPILAEYRRKKEAEKRKERTFPTDFSSAEVSGPEDTTRRAEAPGLLVLDDKPLTGDTKAFYDPFGSMSNAELKRQLTKAEVVIDGSSFSLVNLDSLLGKVSKTMQIEEIHDDSMLTWLRKYSSSQKREAKGTSKGGQFANTLSPIEGEGAPHELGISALEEAERNNPRLKGKTKAAIARFEEKIAPRRTAIKRTLAALEAANETDFKEGKEWYSSVHDWTAKIAKENKLYPETVRGVVAALSPGYQWDAEYAVVPFLAQHVNGSVKVKDLAAMNAYLDVAELPHVKNGEKLSTLPLTVQARVLKHMYDDKHDDGFYGSGLQYGYGGVEKAIAQLQKRPKTAAEAEQNVNECLHGPKVRSFYNSIASPHGNDVTADIWMVRVFTGDGKRSNDSTVTSTPSFTPKVGGASYPIGMYPVAADVVREAARQWNERHPDREPLSAPEAQAIVWTHVRNNQANVASKTKIKNYKRKNKS